MTDFNRNEVKKNIQNGRLKNSINSQYFFSKISWIGPLVSRIDWCKGHWCGSTYMLWGCPTLAQKQAKSAFFVFLSCFWAYIGQPHDHIGWPWTGPLSTAVRSKQIIEIRVSRKGRVQVQLLPSNQHTLPWQDTLISWIFHYLPDTSMKALDFPRWFSALHE